MPREKKTSIADTLRLSGNVLEYYMKYGREREIEKFMRFRSPKNSSDSSNEEEKGPKHLSCEQLNRIAAEAMEPKSQSMPAISNSHSSSQSEESKENREHIIPIRLEDEQDVSVLKTPKRQSEDKPKQIQTPESAAKAHKRLEWDSLADVGYQKSKSTSNISIVERMLLREFFEVSSNSPKPTNSSENDIRQLEQEIADLGTLKKHFTKTVTKDESKYSSPPLAHSTQYENSDERKNSRKLKVKGVQASTNTTSSLQQKFEKYAQTSLRNTEMKSQEVQVTLRPDDTSPYQVSSSVSSFEYHSRHTSNSSGNKSTNSSHLQKHQKTADEEQHPFVKGVREILEKRKVLSAKNDGFKDSTKEPDLESENIRRLYSDFQQMLGENKENSTTVSDATSSSNASTIDFGIQLIFNIMKSKSVDSQQKKKLVKSIVKRITKIANSCELHGIVSKTSALFANETDEDSKNMEREKASSSESNKRKNTNMPIVSHTETSNSKAFSEEGNKSEKSEANVSHSLKKMPLKDSECGAESEISSIAIEQLAPCKRSTAGKDQKHASSTSTSSASPKAVQVTLAVAPDGRIMGATTTKLECKPTVRSTSTTGTSTLSTSSSTSHDPSTQKPIRTNDYAVSMKDWLDPMTQSEIDFEKKKRVSLQAKRKNTNAKDLECREEQLNWIECEIERLQSLRNLLIKDEKRRTPEAEEATEARKRSPLRFSTATQASEQLYDTVYSDQSKKSSCAPQEKSVASCPTKAKRAEKTITSPKRSHHQRSKMETPYDSNDQESISSLVRRRKKELLNHYQPPKSHHCTCVPQTCILQGPSTSAAAAMASQLIVGSCGMYSQPILVQPNVQPAAYYTYPPSAHGQGQWPTGETAIRKTAHFHNVPITSARERPASSSAFRGSSELTVPMGSYGSSGTPTTTHQYDDVAGAAAAAVANRPAAASQTGASLQRSKPIYETRQHSPHPIQNMMPYHFCGRSTMCVQTHPSRATAYALQFVVREQPDNSTNGSSTSTSTSSTTTTTSTSEELRVLAAQAGPSLQDALQQRRPEFLKHAKDRKSIINRIQKMRQEREQELRKIADDNLSVTSLDRKLNNLPPPATERLRLFSTKQMKALSKKRIAKLPNPLQERQREERTKRSNRLLREVYNRRLQKRVRDGKLDFEHSRTLI